MKVHSNSIKNRKNREKAGSVIILATVDNDTKKTPLRPLIFYRKRERERGREKSLPGQIEAREGKREGKRETGNGPPAGAEKVQATPTAHAAASISMLWLSFS